MSFGIDSNSTHNKIYDITVFMYYFLTFFPLCVAIWVIFIDLSSSSLILSMAMSIVLMNPEKSFSFKFTMSTFTKRIYVYFIYLYMWGGCARLLAYVYITCFQVSMEARRQCQIPLELESQVVVSHFMWVSGRELRSSAKRALNCWAPAEIFISVLFTYGISMLLFFTVVSAILPTQLYALATASGVFDILIIVILNTQWDSFNISHLILVC